jgi:hypothetical protein
VREFVGIKSPLDLILELKARDVHVPDLLKREALMFSRIGCPKIEELLALSVPCGFEHPSITELIGHFNYLDEQGVLYHFPPSVEGPQLTLLEEDNDYQVLKRMESPLVQLFTEGLQRAGLSELQTGKAIEPEELHNYLPHIEPILAPTFIVLQYFVRLLSLQLRVIHGVEAYPVLSEIVPQIPIPRPNKCDVVDVVINALPIPGDSTPWEQIIEYRSDPDSLSKFLALRHWMSEVARAELTPAEVEEKLEYLIDQYDRHMKFHRIKTNVGTLETVVTTGAEILGDLASFKWGKAVEALFSLKRRQVALLEGELTAPGNEVAYIVKARELFS